MVVDLPVGQNLQDRQNVFLNTKINSSFAITDKLKNSFWSNLKFLLFCKGPLTVSGADGSAFLYTDESHRGKRSFELKIVFFSSFVKDNKFNFKQELVDEYWRTKITPMDLQQLFSVLGQDSVAK